jgi:stage II sporulation protein D
MAVEPAPVAEALPGDPLELLWGHRLDFSGGAPVVTIRIVEGRDAIDFSPRGACMLVPRGGAPVQVPAGTRLRARTRDARPASLAVQPLLAQLEARDRAGLERARAAWEARGIRTRVRAAGGIYGIAGKVIDNRRSLLVAEGTWTEGSARAFADEAFSRWGERPDVHVEASARPAGVVEVIGPDGAALAAGESVVALEVPGGEGFGVEQVNRDPLQPGRGTESRTYRGRLLITLDAAGRLAAVDAVALEELLRGLVPSEMPAGAPPEALKAQAVTARSNVLAQIGTRHLADPYALCAEVHCQAYRGDAAHAPSTDVAVRATAGEALFGSEDRRLVDGVYSAMCGGHGEDNELVWGNVPDPSLRGHLDLPAAAASRWAGGLATASRLESFLDAAPPAWCARAPGARPDRYRWERRIGDAEMEALLRPLGVGRVVSLALEDRGVSGRARTLRVQGERGSAVVRGELSIRRTLGNLPSAMAIVARAEDGWVLRGGGWGHGAGMCQWGAIGRAAAGQGYREILRAYYSGADAARIY